MDPTNVMGRRIGAYLIDALIGTVVAIVAFVALSDTVDTSFDPCGFEQSPTLCFYADGTVYFAEGGDATAIVLIPIGFWLLMGWVVQGATGGTPGKLMVGLRVVDQNSGRLAGFGKCLGRTLMWIVDGQPGGMPLVGLITGAASKGHRRVGDMVASTLVVDKSQVGIPPVVPGLTTVAGNYAPGPPVGAPQVPVPGYQQPTITPSPAYQDPTTSPHAVAMPSDPTQPQWDASRNTWIQWDAPSNRWLAWNETTQQWVALQ